MTTKPHGGDAHKILDSDHTDNEADDGHKISNGSELTLADLGSLPIWLAWQEEAKDGGAPKKVPYLARARAGTGSKSELESAAQFDFCEFIEAPRSAASRAREVEPFYTLKEAAALLNLKYWHLLRMSRRGELRLYKPGSGRHRVLLSEVMEAIRRCSEQVPSLDSDKGARHA